MDFEAYRVSFSNAASAAGAESDAILAALMYAENLHRRHLPIIYDAEHLSLLTGYKVSFLYSASNSPINYYRRFVIPKKNGEGREIAEPLPSLKEIQYWILKNILEKIAVSKYAKGFAKNTSIRRNASFHRAQPLVLNLDVENFFGSLSFRSCFHVFFDAGYSKPVSGLLAGLCTLENGLPQGAPTSPALSNCICRNFDETVGARVISQGCRYTRYADDITISGIFRVSEMIRLVSGELFKLSLRLNKEKTRVMGKGSRQEVTGIIVNSSKLSVPKEMRRKIRLLAYYITKYGLDDHLLHTENMRRRGFEHYAGLANFALFIDPEFEDAIKLKEALIQLRSDS